MTLNLVTNIRLFLSGKVKGLNTSGLIIRKIDTEYTAFYISLTKETMCVIPKPLSKEELLEIYTSHEINKHIFSLPEFFGMDKKYKLD